MRTLPITRMTLYKHGVGFYERRAALSGEEVDLAFRSSEMNDILKSLTVLDWGKGSILGVEYPTPQSQEERLAGCAIHLSDSRSLRDLLISLRGRQVRLWGEPASGSQAGVRMTGLLLGIDEPESPQPLNTSLVSVLLDKTNQVMSIALARLQGVEILDERGSEDLRFFLHTAASQQQTCPIKIRLTEGAHDLSVQYIAAAPTWRVSYRLMTGMSAMDGTPYAMLLGWGVFDNTLEEDLKDISLSLVAGMPVSFIYDLYTPFTPERPTVKEEERTVPAPPEFAAPVGAPAPQVLAMKRMARVPQAEAAAGAAMPDWLSTLEESVSVTTEGKSLGELFQYKIESKVTVGRGQSAMVPILSTNLPYRKVLLYNKQELPEHPIATLRFKNESGLTLERGPVTVIENAEYVGEAILPFTSTQGELLVSYAVELGININEQSRNRMEYHKLSLEKSFLHIEQWSIDETEYHVANRNAQPAVILVEHPRKPGYELVDSPQPAESTEAFYRFEIQAPAQAETVLKVQERCLVSSREEVRRQSYSNLEAYLQRGLIDRRSHDRLVDLLKLWEKLDDCDLRSKKIEEERKKIYKWQEQIRGNMQSLGAGGKEGELRASYVDKLRSSEGQLQSLSDQESALAGEVADLEKEIAERIETLNSSN